MTDEEERAEDQRMEADINRAFDFFQKVLKDPDAYDHLATVIIDLDSAPEVFSAERVRLLKTLRDAPDGYASGTELAKKLRRDPSRVSRDLDVLEDAGLVTRTRAGKAKRIRYRRGAIMLE